MGAGGRPTKFKKEYIEQAYKLALLGLDDKQMASFFDVTEKTFNNWKNSEPLFFQSLKDGKPKADAEVAKSLFERAKGYSCPDTHICTIKGKVVLTPFVKHYPPDTTAAIIWLKNRQPGLWRDKQDYDGKMEIEIKGEIIEDE